MKEPADILRSLLADGDGEAHAERARSFLRGIEPTAMAKLETALVAGGVRHRDVKERLCGHHLALVRSVLEPRRREPPPLHPVHTLMEEHRHIERSLGELAGVVQRLRSDSTDAAWRAERGALGIIAHHLVDAENHHQREEEALFPRLEKLGFDEPALMMREDHEEFRRRKRRLYQLVNGAEPPAAPAERGEVIEIGDFLVRELTDHIAKEDHVVYQIALDVIAAEEWAAVKRECDALGYCCFKPADQAGAGARDAVLDVRFVPMHRRLQTVLDAWRALAPGAVLRITVDHEPQPLRALFAEQEAGRHEWSWERQGPPEWVVAIRRKP